MSLVLAILATGLLAVPLRYLCLVDDYGRCVSLGSLSPPHVQFISSKLSGSSSRDLLFTFPFMTNVVVVGALFQKLF